tara:strand:+ start:533 stop:793 length:261 start_codon:yes stop_codon:yes gene_type:complete
MGRSTNFSMKGYSDNEARVVPETKLFSAVLAQAVHDIFSDHVDKTDRDSAMDFLTTDSFHLRMICELAGRDAGYVRGKIRAKLLDE